MPGGAAAEAMDQAPKAAALAGPRCSTAISACRGSRAIRSKAAWTAAAGPSITWANSPPVNSSAPVRPAGGLLRRDALRIWSSPAAAEAGSEGRLLRLR